MIFQIFKFFYILLSPIKILMEIYQLDLYIKKFKSNLYKKVVLIMELPITPVGRILKNNGAQKISDDAKIALAEVIEEYGKIAQNTIKFIR